MGEDGENPKVVEAQIQAQKKSTDISAGRIPSYASKPEWERPSWNPGSPDKGKGDDSPNRGRPRDRYNDSV